ncbi:hypothetical protein ACQKLP_14710 [Chitinophaga sp. NPDC101104]|uniref:hypothetical protein n=1 Tax=Chitinophaga sp. NPDC101104 TaxID=3390561 RepID=UPI003D066274
MDTLFVESDANECSQDLYKFVLEESFGMRLICDFASLSEYREAMIDNPMWELLIDKFDKIEYNVNLEGDVLTDRFYESLWEQNLFLLTLNEDVCNELSCARGYIYVSSANIEKAWNPIKLIRENSTLKVTQDKNFPTELKFDSWEKLKERILPLTSLIIFDRYILCDNSNQKLKDNLFVVLKMFCINKLTKPLNLTIISEFDSDYQLKNAYQKIQEFLAQNGIENVSLSLIDHDKGKYPVDFEGLHSRQILTNNIRIKCEDSFNLFKANGKVNNDADIHFKFNLSNKNHPFFEKEINHLKRYVGRLNNVDESSTLARKTYYYRDKVNYLF